MWYAIPYPMLRLGSTLYYCNIVGPPPANDAPDDQGHRPGMGPYEWMVRAAYAVCLGAL